MNLMAKKFLKFCVALGIAVFILYFLIKKISIVDFKIALQSTNYEFLLLAFLSYIVLNLIRAWRFDLILGGQIGFFRILNIVFLQNFWNTFLPFRIGELSYVYLINKGGDVSLGKNIASLIGARLMDFFSIAIIFLSSFFWISSIGSAQTLAMFSAGLLIIVALVFSALVWGGCKIKDFIFKLKNKTRNKFLLVIFEKSGETLENFNLFRLRGLMLKTFLLSFSIWILAVILGIFLFKATNISLGFAKILFVYFLPILFSLSPFYTPAGLGIYEGSLASGLILFGLEPARAIAAGFIIHAEELLFVIILAIIGYISFKFCKYGAQ